MTNIFRNDLIFSLSYALDYVEREMVMVSSHHSKRVAYLAASMGRSLGYGDDELLDLASCAALHDNALSEYLHENAVDGRQPSPEDFRKNLELHCEIGERNISALTFYPSVKGAILYHHENADGSGPLGKFAEDTPVFARLIHVADTMDAKFDLGDMSQAKLDDMRIFVRQSAGSLYDSLSADAFLGCFSRPEDILLDAGSLDRRLGNELPERMISYAPDALMRLAGLFSKIIDYKSPFTCRHSSGMAEKARRMAEYYGWDEDVQAQLYLAGALHDVGKLMIRSEILEKPGRLTSEEYRSIQDHAYGSYTVLHSIRGMESISRWAYLHHEKLDGSGYPFGLKAENLGREERLLACLDIYQALREERPYKPGMAHTDAMAVLSGMAAGGQLDAGIVGDIHQCFKDEAA